MDACLWGTDADRLVQGSSCVPSHIVSFVIDTMASMFHIYFSATWSFGFDAHHADTFHIFGSGPFSLFFDL